MLIYAVCKGRLGSQSKRTSVVQCHTAIANVNMTLWLFAIIVIVIVKLHKSWTARPMVADDTLALVDWLRFGSVF